MRFHQTLELKKYEEPYFLLCKQTYGIYRVQKMGPSVVVVQVVQQLDI